MTDSESAWLSSIYGGNNDDDDPQDGKGGVGKMNANASLGGNDDDDEEASTLTVNLDGIDEIEYSIGRE